jgi:UDP:flavonoid glycosyltransferase YjiC (YdhE family)
MARIVIATVPVIGHITPFLPLARALAARGHELTWYTGEKYRRLVERTGARFHGYREAKDIDEADLDRVFPERARLRGVAQLKFDMKHVFIDVAPGQLADLRQLTRQFPADLVLADPGMIGALFLQESGGPACGILGVLPLTLSSAEVAPFGLGLAPSASSFGLLRNKALNAFVQNIAFRDVQKHWNQTRASVGLPATGWWLDSGPARARFYLQPSIPSFEYPRSNLAHSLHFIGMMPAERPLEVALPPFWQELDGRRPVVHVTQGTLANTKPDLFAPALAGLADEDLWIVISTGNRPLESLGLGTLPKNARVASFLSYPELLPKTALMLTNGGYGGAQLALSHGVPLIVAGASEDKPEVAARVAWSGAGINLKTGRPSAQQVRRAVRSVLDDPRYRAHAEELQREYQRHDAVQRALAIIEKQLGAPVREAA